ncbi:MAG: imidazole glycerol phosphate synthase subunit HisH, partial [Alphaproteobacteria bacterium]|nr:imidazole glycerol phosphate synthase subunit HisH [Alphaproteobacteria bacterium]
MADKGLEHGETAGLGWLAGTVEAITPSDPALKIPHMGWNELQLSAHGMVHPVFQDLGADAHAYFVHSYAYEPEDEDMILASVDYGGPVVAAVGRDNLVGTQFHPEKSQRTGLRLIANFLKWRP